jgi:hypothetical protein
MSLKNHKGHIMNLKIPTHCVSLLKKRVKDGDLKGTIIWIVNIVFEIAFITCKVSMLKI